MPGLKTNEREGTRAVLRYCRMSAYKAREVLDLIRGHDVARAAEILRFSQRDAARVVAKVLDSAVANAEANDGIDPEELFVSACYADEGTTIKRWRPRARGRATRIRKRTCHITVIVSRLPEERLERLRARQAADLAARRARRVASSQRRTQGPEAEEATPGAAAEAEAEGIVDDQAAAVEAAEAEFSKESPAEGGAEATDAEGGEEPGGAAADIVDQQAPAVEAAESAASEGDAGTEQEEEGK